MGKKIIDFVMPRVASQGTKSKAGGGNQSDSILYTPYTLFSIHISEILNVFTIVDMEESRRRSLIWSLMFLGVGGAHFVGHLLSTGLFGVAGEKLTRRLRRLSFQAILR